MTNPEDRPPPAVGAYWINEEDYPALLRMFTEYTQGRRQHEFITPGSEDSTHRIRREGLLDIFQEAGALVLPAGCGVCASGRMGLVHSGEISISDPVFIH